MDKATAPDWGTIGMTVEEAADTLRVERRSVLDAIANRGLPAVRIGRGWRIDPDALKAWIASGEPAEQASDAYEVRCEFYNDKDQDTLSSIWEAGAGPLAAPWTSRRTILESAF